MYRACAALYLFDRLALRLFSFVYISLVFSVGGGPPQPPLFFFVLYQSLNVGGGPPQPPLKFCHNSQIHTLYYRHSVQFTPFFH